MPRSELLAGEVHLFQTRSDNADHPDEQIRTILSPDELARAQRFHYESDRRMFTVARGLTRIVLGEYLSLQPSDLKFDLLPHGKPMVAPVQNPDKIEFNIAHSGNMIVMAFAIGIRVGVDVEWSGREIGDRDAIAERFFAPGEVSRYQALPEEEKHRAFVNCWTRKEAFVKAIGDGLSMPLSDFEVSFERDQPARIISDTANAWSVYSWEPKFDYAAALVAERTNQKPARVRVTLLP